LNPAAILLIETSAADTVLIRAALVPVVPPDQLMVAADGAEAVDYLLCRGAHADRNPAELPQLVLLDLSLSNLDALRAIRAAENTRLLPVAVLSAAAGDEEVRTALQLGANSFVRKPADAAELARRISLLAHYWLELNIPPPATKVS